MASKDRMLSGILWSVCIISIEDATSDLNNQIRIRYIMESVGGNVIKLGLSSVGRSTSLESNLTKSNTLFNNFSFSNLF